jgi:flavin reductase (DIM6/NTAB) family NADH-FMN oxidoreductase RutF
MKKSLPISNNFCPQTLFLYGAYKDDGTPNFGLFCWFSYIWDNQLGVMACIGGDKLTKDRIRATGVFSANLVTEELLPIADYFGNTNGYDADKMKKSIAIEKGQVLSVPVLTKSPWVFELEVSQAIPLHGGDVFICKIRNVLADECLCDESVSIEKRIQSIAPVRTTCQTYFSWNGSAMGSWGDPMKNA